MTAHRILQLNAVSTAACAAGMLATRGVLHSFFGLETPRMLDIIAILLIAYVAVLALIARQPRVDRGWLLAFAAVDALWVLGSAIVLIAFWTHLAPTGRILIVAVAIAVEVFATLQFRAVRTT